MNRIARTAIALMSLAFASASVFALDDGWPRTLTLDEGMVTIYQPQIEALDEGVLYYRAALAYRATADAEPIFGAGWLKAPVAIDEKEGVVHPRRLELTQARFPEGTADVQAEIASALLPQSMTWNLDFPVDELEAALNAAEAESLAAQKLKTAPPRILYRDHPALLVTIDGDPVEREIENSPYRAVINTPFPLITDGDDYFLNAAKGVWYRADAATGPYRFDASPPKAIVQMVEDAEAKAAVETRPEDVAERPPVSAENAPEIVVSTVPAELIVTDGPADFVPLIDDLLVLKNSDDDVFMHVGEQKYYIVLAGRWYRAGSLEGPWEYQAADALPASFAKIPDDSAQADSRVYVAGTPEAQDAVLDAQVPQTAAVKRGEVDVDVEYDGDPEFDRVDGTEDLRYAKNTGATVLESDRTYYLLEDGVWYVSSSPHGPWVVSDHRPGELDSVEPSSPVYNTKYVYVYDSTPEVVYVGYTPGYLGSYVYYDTIVYGTGWYYRPWVSPYYYYPRYSTWGFHVGYSDWGGWAFGLSWYWPYHSLNYYYGGYWHYGQSWYTPYWGYWGPRGYCYRPYYYGHGYGHHGYRHHDYYDKGYGGGHGDYRGYYNRHDKYASGYHRDGDDFHRGGNDGGRGYDRYGRERNRNLYRDEGQRAPVAQTRDRWRNDAGPRRDFVQADPGRDVGAAPRRDDAGAAPRRDSDGEQRFVDNRKIDMSKTGPVRRSDLQAKAQVRDVNQAASREPMMASRQGEVYRASFDNGGPRDAGAAPRRDVNAASSNDVGAAPRRDVKPASSNDVGAAPRRDPQRREPSTKARDSRTQPISREELRQRGDFVASRSETAKPSVNRPLPEPSRSVERSNREFASQPREVATRKAPDPQPDRQVSSQPRQVASQTREFRPERQATAPAQESRRSRQVATPAPEDRSSRQVASTPKQVQQRAPQTQPNRQVSAPVRRDQAPAMRMDSRAPSRQVSQAPAPPPRSAPAPRPPQQGAPQMQQRSAPAPQQRSAPRQEAPRQQAERGAPRGDRGDARPERGQNRDRRRN